jgi:hypothetical protein
MGIQQPKVTRQVAMESFPWTIETLRAHLLTLIESNDNKYAERYESSQTAMNAAFVAQQTALAAGLAAQKLAVDAALAAADRAVTKAEVAAEKRFEGVNEFRATLADQQRTLMPRGECELIFKGLTDKIDLLSKQLGVVAGQRSGVSEGWGMAIGAFGIVAAIVMFAISFVLKH